MAAAVAVVVAPILLLSSLPMEIVETPVVDMGMGMGMVVVVGVDMGMGMVVMVETVVVAVVVVEGLIEEKRWCRKEGGGHCLTLPDY